MRDKIFKLILIAIILSVYIFFFNKETIELIIETNRIFVEAIENYYNVIEKQKRMLQDINSQIN
jgi:hypothetical protein|tara:strand:+ start:437 stop:628 length:192 start_codon:yes stop_codon:yes gene_type:complete